MPKLTLRNAAIQLLTLNQIAIIVLSIALVAIPHVRGTSVQQLFKVLFYVQCFWLTFRVLRAGRGSQTPDEMAERLRNGTAKPLTTGIERVASVAAMVAIVVLIFS